MAAAKKAPAQKAPAPPWADVDATARQIETTEGQYGARVTHISTDADATPELWVGTYGNAAVIAGDVSVITLSDGRTFDAAGEQIPQENQ